MQKRKRWLGALWPVLVMWLCVSCEMGAGTECVSDDECGYDHYCADCGLCVLEGNEESEAFWCSKIYERTYASEEGTATGTSCGSYSDRGINDGQTKPFCQAAYSYGCQGREDAVKAQCETLEAFSSEAKSMCPYCDSY